MKPESKRGFPGGFFVFLLLAVLVILTIQNLSNDKTAKVSFSHQLEHLVNLDLIHKDESRKIALNDNLVTFSSRFQDRQSEEGKLRYRYLELLSRNQDLKGQKSELEQSLTSSRENVKTSAELFLQLTGQVIPKGGYKVVDPIYNTSEHENAVIINKLSESQVTSLADLEKIFPSISQDPNPAALEAYGRDLLTLVERFRSPALGIGNEAKA